MKDYIIWSRSLEATIEPGLYDVISDNASWGTIPTVANIGSFFFVFLKPYTFLDSDPGQKIIPMHPHFSLAIFNQERVEAMQNNPEQVLKDRLGEYVDYNSYIARFENMEQAVINEILYRWAFKFPDQANEKQTLEFLEANTNINLPNE